MIWQTTRRFPVPTLNSTCHSAKIQRGFDIHWQARAMDPFSKEGHEDYYVHLPKNVSQVLTSLQYSLHASTTEYNNCRSSQYVP